MINKKKKIMVVLIVLALFFTFGKNCHAWINEDGASQLSQDVASIVKKVIGNLLSLSVGVLGSVIAPLINVFSLIIFVVLYVLFVSSGLTGGSASTMLAFPFPDQIVFNKIPLLDPNFIHPYPDSVGAMAQSVLQKLYSSFFVLALSIFVIAALIIGIKLVFSSIAAEKAQYKEALNTWIFGIVLLFLSHYLLAGMFYLNEKIVENVSEGVVDHIPIKIEITDAIPVVGKSIGKLINSVAGIFGASESITDVTVYGYGGIVLKFAIAGLIGQDLISSIVFLIIIGQTFGLMITYLKRVFMCIFLGVMAPLIVAVDVVQKSLKS